MYPDIAAVAAASKAFPSVSKPIGRDIRFCEEF
jgi:hypothetical protein